MSKHHPPRMSILLIALMVQLQFVLSAQADTVSEWGVWANGEDPPTQGNLPNNNSTFQPNPDQIRTSVNDGNLLEIASPSGDWIGYLLYNASSGNNDVAANNKIASLTLNPIRSSRDITANPRQFPIEYAGTLEISSDVDLFKMSFDSANNNLSTQSKFVFGDTDAKFNGFVPQSTDFRTASSSRKFTKTYFGEIQMSTFEPRFASGRGFFGKIMPVADIAYLASANSSYLFEGFSQNGSDVSITINFFEKSWQGDWTGASSGTYTYNDFRASGTITGTKLISESITPINTNPAQNVNNTVRGGSVEGTIVGIANTNIIDAAVVGKAELNVGNPQNEVSRRVNDVFAATYSPTNLENR